MKPSKFKGIFLFCILFLIIYFLSPLGKTSLIMTVTSNVNGNSHLFYYPPNSGPTEDHLAISRLSRGENTLSFELPSKSQSLRWDPVDTAGGIFEIKNVYLRVGLKKYPISIDAFSPITGALILSKQDNQLKIGTEGTDPQMSISIAPSNAFLWQKFFILLTAILLTIVFVLIFSIGSLRIRAFIDQEQPAIKSFPTFFIIAAICHFTALSHFSISIDDELFAFQAHHDVWIEQGRWTNYFFQQFILPQPIVPYFPNLLFILFITASYLFIIRAHDIKINVNAYLLFPIFCAFPTWGFLAEFYANLPSAGFGLLLISMAIYFFRKSIVEPIIKNEPFQNPPLLYTLLIQSILVAVAIGAYQSFVLTFVVIGIGILLFTIIEQQATVLAVIKSLLFLCVLTLMSLIIYTVIQYIMLDFYGLNIHYIDRYYQLDLLFNAPLQIITKVLPEIGLIYSGKAALYGTSLSAIAGLMALGLLTVCFNKRTIQSVTLILFSIGLAAIIIITPFTLNFLTGPTDTVPLRSLTGLPYVLWFFALLALMNSKRFIRELSMILIIIGTFQIFYANSLYAASMQLIQKHDALLASSIYQQIAEANPNFDRSKNYPVYFYGENPTKIIYPDVYTTTMAVSFFSWPSNDDGAKRIVNYMKILGFNNLEVLNPAKQDAYKLYFKTMPAWPAADSVKVINGVTLVKLGESS